jgi:SAM-dependent methyltransferase
MHQNNYIKKSNSQPEPSYNTIGKNTNVNRRADPRIVAALKALLDLPIGSLLADVGAGTGNYANALADLDYRVIAVEPSEVMRNQAVPRENVTWLAGNDWRADINDFPLPRDLADKNMHSGWGSPEQYFDEQMRLNTSGFANADKAEVERGLSRLREDLRTGTWDTRHGHLRKQDSLNTGFVFMKLSSKK